MVGNWKIDINTGGMPQKVASAIGKINETLMGAEYEPIAYIGSQVVNGINHAVLAKQTIITGKDTENIVLLIFNEKPNDMEATLVGIERVVEGGGEFGGVHIGDPTTDIPEDAKTAWDEVFTNFVGSEIEPFAYLGSQVVNGVNFIFAVTISPVVPNANKNVAIITVNTLTKNVIFTDLLNSKHDNALGYSFTWLKNRNFGSPLGEWP
jgi:hypothetical protein